MGSPEAQASLANGGGRQKGALHPFRFGGEALVAHVSGALLWPGAKALVVSDLHLEKGAALARSGTFLPPYDSLETLDRLDALVAQTQPEIVISLGDSFHDPQVIEALGPDLLARLQRLTGLVQRFVWVTGNHDPDIPAALALDFHLAIRMTERPDFREGVRAVLIEKSNDAVWQPSRLEDVTDSMIDAVFDPAGLPDL